MAAIMDTPRTKAMRAFLVKEAHRVTGLSIEADGVFIYTDSSRWCDDSGSGTFRADSETAAIKAFYARVQDARVETLTAVTRNPELRELATVDIRPDALHFTVWAGPVPIGTIFAPFPGYPHHRKDWQAFSRDGVQLPGVVAGPRGALRKIVRHAFEAAETPVQGIHVLPALEPVA